MSEFSESFHLRAGSGSDAVGLLERASVRGFVFPRSGSWVPFVCGGTPADLAAALAAASPEVPPPVAEFLASQRANQVAIERVLCANTSTLLHYRFAADHECTVQLYEGARRTGVIHASFDDGAWHFDAAAFLQSGVLGRAACADLKAWLETAAAFHDRQLHQLTAKLEAEYLADRYFVARILGLTDYTWLSFEYELDATPGVPDRIPVGLSDSPRPAG